MDNIQGLQKSRTEREIIRGKGRDWRDSCLGEINERTEQDTAEQGANTML